MYTKKTQNKNKRRKNQKYKKKAKRGTKKEMMVDLMSLVKNKKYRDAAPIGESLIQTHGPDSTVFLCTSKCFIEIGKFKKAHEFLSRAEEMDSEDLNVKFAYLNLFKRWGEHLEMGASIGMGVLDHLLSKSESPKVDKIFKVAKDTFEIILMINHKKVKKLIDGKTLYHVMESISKMLQKQDKISNSFIRTFSSFSVKMNKNSVISSKQFSSIMWDLMPYLKDDETRDNLFFSIVREFEMLEQKSDIYKFLNTTDETFTKLTSFTYFKLKYGVFWDTWLDHVKVLTRVSNLAENFTNVPYFTSLIFYAKEFMDILGMSNELNFDIGVDLHENKIIEKFEKCLTRNKIQIKDNLKPNRKNYQLVNDEFTDDTILHFLRKFETRAEYNFEIVKRIIFRRALVEDIQDYVLKEICDFSKKWILRSRLTTPIVKFEAFVFILDVEDFLGLNVALASDTKKLIAEISKIELDPVSNAIFELEKSWQDLNLNDMEVIKNVLDTYEEILTDPEIDFKENSYLQRRVIVAHNRLELLNLISEVNQNPEDEKILSEMKQRFVNLNIDFPQNLISQHNMVVTLLLMGNKEEAGTILDKVTSQNQATLDENFTRVFLSSRPDNIDFILKYAEDFDIKPWYCYIRGLNHYHENEYGEAYNFLQLTLKKLKYQCKRQDYDPIVPSKFILNLSKLKSGRYSTKALFNDDYIRENCPVLFTDRLKEEELQTHLNRVNCLVGVLNKLLAKPKSAINNFKDLIQEMTAKVGEEMEEESEKGPYDEIFEAVAKEYLNIQETRALRTGVSNLNRIANKEKRDVAIMAHGELALCYSYSEEFRNALLNLLIYTLASKENICDLVVLESLLYFYRSLDNASKPKLSKLVIDFIKSRHDIILEKIHSKDVEASTYSQQVFFLSVYVLFTIGDQEDIEELYNDERVTAIIDDKKTDDSIGFNLKIMNPEAKNTDLIKDFSGNNKAWIFYFLKTEESERNLPSKLAALLLSLNLNYDNQFIWTIISRFLNEMAMNKASYQSLNMARVFRISSEAEETQYSTLIWMKILRRVEFEARNQGKGEEIVDNLKEIIGGMNVDDNVFLREVTFKENKIIKDKIDTTRKSSSDEIKAKVIRDIKDEKYHQLIKRVILYIIHLRKFDVDNCEEKMKEFIQKLKQDKGLRKVIKKAIKGYLFKHSSMFDQLFLKNFCITLNSLMIKICLNSEDEVLQNYYQNNILNSISSLILNEDGGKNILGELLDFSTEGKDENLKKLVDFCIKSQAKIPVGNEEEVLSVAKRCLYLHPQNEYVRFLSNSIFLLHGIHEGIFVYKDHQYSLNNNLFELTSQKEAMSGSQKIAKIKTGFYIDPENGIFSQLMNRLREGLKNQGNNEENEIENIDEKLVEIKTGIMTDIFGITDEEEQEVSAFTVWESSPSATPDQMKNIQALAVIDCLQLFSRLNTVVKEGIKEDEELEILGEKVLENTALNKIYFIPYLQYLYNQRRLEEFEEWLEVLTFLKVPLKVEFLVNYHVLLLKIQEMSQNPDDEENDQVLNELFTYFNTKCKYSEISTSANAMGQVYKKYISKEITENAFKANIKNILQKGGKRSLNVLKKFIN